jgi:hypothetical protein
MYNMMAYVRVQVWAHTFLISPLDRGEWSAFHPSHFTPQGNNTQHPMDRRMGGRQKLSGWFGDGELTRLCWESKLFEKYINRGA